MLDQIFQINAHYPYLYTMQHYYAILGLQLGASQQEIKDAYRKKAMELHPDHNSSQNAPAQFAEIEEAYEALYNTQSEYDNRFPATTEKSTEAQNSDIPTLYNDATWEETYAKWENVFAAPKDPEDRKQWEKVRDEKRKRRKQDNDQFHQKGKKEGMAILGGMAIFLVGGIIFLGLIIVGLISAFIYFVTHASGSSSNTIGAILVALGSIGSFFLIRKLYRGTLNHFKKN